LTGDVEKTDLVELVTKVDGVDIVCTGVQHFLLEGGNWTYRIQDPRT